MTTSMSTAGQPQILPLTRYRLIATFEQDLLLPDYAGSLLRGVFGAALRRTACMTSLPDCKACPLLRTCPYPAIFETPPQQTQLGQRFSHVPNPYVVEPPAPGTRWVPAGEPVVWHMVLMGDEPLRQLPLVVHAWQRSLRYGWGREAMRTVGELREVLAIASDGQAIGAWDSVTDRVLAHAVPWQAPDLSLGRAGAAADALVLNIHTPLRLQHEGHPLGVRELNPRVLVAHLLRRVTLMLELHMGLAQVPFDARALVAHAETLHDDRTQLRWKDWTRYSSRQKQEMTLGGVMGRWLLRGDLAPIWPWLHLGQWLHVGKNATMGMGGYTLELASVSAT